MTNHYEVEQTSPVAKAALGFLLVLVGVLASMPWWADAGLSSTVVEFLYYLAIAQMWNLLAGYGGLVSIGQQAYIGIGAYTLAAIALHTNLHPFLSVPIAGVVAAVIAWPVSKLLFRLNGAYFAVGTWVVAEVFRLLLANFTPLGGGTGTSITASLAALDEWWRDAMIFWIALGLAVASVLGVYLFLRSRNGLALTAIRDSEIASESLGVRVPKLKLAVYVVSALGCAMIGALIYLVKLRVSPDSAFSVEWSALAFLMVIIGGFGTIEGPIIGALVYFLLRSLLADHGTAYLIALGVIAIVVMLVERKGVWGAIQKRFAIELFPVQRRLKVKSPERS
jgi:branched-chain amino acid transport system permease protein